MVAAIPLNEEQRLKALYNSFLLDSEAEKDFDEVALLASQICGTPIAYISFIDKDRQWFKSTVGVEIQETARDQSFCQHTILGAGVVEVENATLDSRFSDNPFVAAGRIVFYAGAPLIDELGNALGTLCVVDVKPRQLTEAQRFALKVLADQLIKNIRLRIELRTRVDALQVLEKVSQNLPGLVYQYRLFPDGSSSFPYVSKLVEGVFGIGADKIRQNVQTVFDLIHPDDMEDFRNSILVSAQSMNSWIYEFRINLPGRGIRWLRGHSHPEKILDGSILWHGFITDITDEKLNQLDTMRRSRLSTLGEMSAGIAHEINNPLSIIKGLSNLLLQRSTTGNLSSDFLNKSLGSIDETVNRIAAIIRGLKSFARDGSEDPMMMVSFNSIIEDSMNLCQTKFKNKDVKFTVEPLSPDVYISARPSQVAQILINLLNNAFDAVQESRNKWIKLSCVTSETNVEVHISDSGRGVPEAIREKILQPFFTTKEIGKGTGLGLSISLGIAKTHGGTLELDTNAAHTTFVLKLPIVKSGK